MLRRDQLACVVDAIQDAVFVRDPEGKILYINAAAAELVGVAPAEAVGRACTELFCGADPECMRTCPARSVGDDVENAERFPDNIEVRGQKYQMEVMAAPLLDGDREIGTVVTLHDATLRLQAEQESRMSRLRVREVSRNARVWFWEVDAEGLYTYASESIADVLGFEPEEVVGKKHFYDLFHPQGREQTKQAAFEGFAARQPFSEFVNRNVHKDGREVWLSTSGVPLLDSSSNLEGYRGADADITPRVEAERALHASEANNRALLEAFPDLMFQIRKDGTFVHYKAPMDDALALPPEAFLGKKCQDTMPPQVAEPSMHHINLALETDEVQTFEYQLPVPLPDGALRDFEARIAPVFDGEVLFIVRDISERRQAERERARLEAQVQHAQKLESIGVLTGGIAHDFNNMLTAILGNADLALREMAPEAPGQDRLGDIKKTARLLADLTNQMLVYSGKGRIVVEKLDLSRLVREMEHLLKLSVSKKAILRFELPESLPFIEADASQIRQVVMNLVVNASEAIGDRSGVVSIRTGILDAKRADLDQVYVDDELAEGIYVVLEVSDTGCGMDDETREKVFDPFFTTKFTGRGLGMSAVLGILRGHGGAITVHSTPEQGATFTVLFPIAELQDRSAVVDGAAHRASSGTGKTVLVVDDEQTVRVLAKIILGDGGYTVVCAEDGRQALEIVRERGDEIDAILLDLTMPHMDGVEAFQEIRKIRQDVPVVLSSGYNEQDATVRFAGRGLSGFLKKPYGIEELLLKINALFDG